MALGVPILKHFRVWLHIIKLFQVLVTGWLFWASWLFETVYQSVSSRLTQRGWKKRDTIGERENGLTTPTCMYCKHSRPLSYFYPDFVACMMLWHWKLPSTIAGPWPPPHARIAPFRVSYKLKAKKYIQQTRWLYRELQDLEQVSRVHIIFASATQWRNPKQNKKLETKKI